MGNYVHQQIAFKCKPKLAKRILREISSKESQFDFEKLVPIPLNVYRCREIDDYVEGFGKHRIWSNWVYENWGTDRLPFDTC